MNSFYRMCSFLLMMVALGCDVHAAFLPQTEDIPLMAGMEIEEKDTFSFDSPVGQILVFKTKSHHSIEEIVSFYQNTLTSLGWTPLKDNIYVREDDLIRISFQVEKEEVFVIFEITLSQSDENQKKS